MEKKLYNNIVLTKDLYGFRNKLVNIQISRGAKSNFKFSNFAQPECSKISTRENSSEKGRTIIMISENEPITIFGLYGHKIIPTGYAIEILTLLSSVRISSVALSKNVSATEDPTRECSRF